jgi:hypothetical protein
MQREKRIRWNNHYLDVDPDDVGEQRPLVLREVPWVSAADHEVHVAVGGAEEDLPAVNGSPSVMIRFTPVGFAVVAGDHTRAPNQLRDEFVTRILRTVDGESEVPLAVNSAMTLWSRHGSAPLSELSLDGSHPMSELQARHTTPTWS